MSARGPSWSTAISNLVVVIVVSLLLWLWAAGQTRETTTVELLVRFASSEPERSVLQPLDAVPVELELRGSRRELERATDRLSGKTITLRSGREGVPGSAGNHVIDLAAILGRTEEVNATGVAIVSAVPGSASIGVLELTTVQATVAPVLPGVQLVGEAIADPATVDVTLPKSLVGSLGATPRVEAFVAAAQANSIEPGSRRALEATLRVPEALETQSRLIRISPERVRVAFTLLSRSSSAILRLVPVQIAGPPADLDGHRIVIDPEDAFLRDVEVSGPSETIRALEDGRAKIFAFVHLSADDLALRVTRKRVDLWMLPPGVTVVRIGESTDLTPTVRIVIGGRS